jgi:cysteine synthase A
LAPKAWEAEAIRACHRLASKGFLFGGFTGTVVSGAMGWLARHDTPELTAVAISPDLGERYLDTVYQTNWVQHLYGDDVLSLPAIGGFAPASVGTARWFGPLSKADSSFCSRSQRTPAMQ